PCFPLFPYTTLFRSGLDPINWRYHAWSGMFLMVMLCVWRWLGVNILYFLAALQNVPNELYEAADIDGATVFQKFRYVTLPFLKRSEEHTSELQSREN